MGNIGVTVLPSMVILKIGQLNIRGSTYQQIERTSSSEKKILGTDWWRWGNKIVGKIFQTLMSLTADQALALGLISMPNGPLAFVLLSPCQAIWRLI